MTHGGGGPSDALRDQGATNLNLPAIGNQTPPEDDLLRAVREAANGAFEVIGEMGRGQRGTIVYLARDLANRRLVALRLERGGGAGEFTLEVVTQLDATVPAVESTCPRCHNTLRGWGRFCPQCGADLAGVDAEPERLRQAVAQAAAGRFEVLGEMRGAEGGGRVYIARDLQSQAIVALRLQLERSGEGRAEFVLDRTRMLTPLAADLAARGTPPAAPPRPAAVPPTPPPARPVPPRPAPPPPTPHPAAPTPGAPRHFAPAPRRGRREQAEELARQAVAWGRENPLLVGGVAALLFLIIVIALVSGGGDRGASRATDSVAVTLRGSLPIGATLTVDDREVRPETTVWLTAGRHVFRISIPGVAPVVDSIEVPAGQALIWSAPRLIRVPSR